MNTSIAPVAERHFPYEKLYELLLKGREKPEEIEDPVTFMAFDHRLYTYSGRDLNEEAEILREGRQLCNSIISFGEKVGQLEDCEDERLFDTAFTDDELEVYYRWIAPLKVEEENRIPRGLMEKYERINDVRNIKVIKKGKRLKKSERAFLDAYENDVLTEEEKDLLKRNRIAMHREHERRYGRSPWVQTLMIYARGLCDCGKHGNSQEILEHNSLHFLEKYCFHRLWQTGKIRRTRFGEKYFSPKEFLSSVLESVQNNELSLTPHSDPEFEESVHDCKYTLIRDPALESNIIEDAVLVYDKICEISATIPKETEDDQVVRILSTAERSFYLKWLYHGIFDKEDIPDNSLFEKDFLINTLREPDSDETEDDDYRLTKEEEEKLDRFYTLFRESAERRIGKTPFSVALIQRARRLFKLLRLSAPKVIIENESKYFCEYYLLHFLFLKGKAEIKN